MKSTSTIDKLYDQYKLQDWNLSSLTADNLNPKREMLLGQVKQIEKAIQDLTDDIVRKRITPKKEDIEEIASSFGGESPIGNLGKSLAALNAGSSDGTIFGEGFSSDIEEEIALLQADLGPAVIDCEKILSKYGFGIAPSNEVEDDDGETTFVVSTVDAIDSSNASFADNDDGNTDVAKCAEIDLTILKIFIALLKIFQLLVKIIVFIMELPIILGEIIQLIAQCWINPPSIALVFCIVLDLVTALIVALISMLIQFLWNLLGMDCVAVQSTEALDKITEMLTSFKNTAALIDIGSVNFLFDGVSEQVESLTSLVKNSIKNIGSDWDEAVNKVKEYFSEEGLQVLQDAAMDAAVNTLQQEYADALAGKIEEGGIDSAIKSVTNSTLIADAKAKAIDRYNEMTNAYESAMRNASSAMDAIKASFSKMQDNGSKMGEFLSDMSIDDLEIE